MQSVLCVGRALVISPHLDDAVLSCGDFLASHADATVATVFAGMPEGRLSLTDYDRQCGFSSAEQAMRTRWAEDKKALSVLGVELIHLDLLDSQYSPLPEAAALAKRLWPVLTDPQWETVFLPMGLFHCDHERVADACMQVVRVAQASPSTQWVLFEDVPYRRRLGVMQKRLAALTGDGWLLAPVALESGQGAIPTTDFHVVKKEALACYRSQLKTLGLSNGGDQDAPERFWSVTLEV